MFPLLPSDDAAFERAAFVIPAAVDLDATPAAVWQVLGSDEMWSWSPAIDRVHWRSAEPRAAGAVRRLRLARGLTIDEEFYRWEPERRATFRVTHQSRHALLGLSEDFVLTPTETGCRLTWTMALTPVGFRRIPRGLLPGPLLRSGNRAALRGIRSLL